MSKPPAIPKPLTLSFVRHVTTPGKFYDGDGLILIVSPNGAKSWMQRLTILGRRRDIGIGSAILLTPSAARKIAGKNKAIARVEGNPLDQSVDMRAPLKTVRVMTLAHFALTLRRRQQAQGTALSEAKKDYRLVKTHVTPLIGRRPVAEVTVSEIRAVLEKVFEDNANTGEAVRTRLMHLFDAVIEEKLRTDNPARSPIARPEKRRKRTTVEGDDRNIRVFGLLPSFMKELMESPRRPTVLRMVRFIILSLRNPKECRLATWDQIDLDNRTWRFPSMQKEGAEMIEVHLHDGLMAILADSKLVRRGDGLGWVFLSSVTFSEPFSYHAVQRQRSPTKIRPFPISNCYFEKSSFSCTLRLCLMKVFPSTRVWQMQLLTKATLAALIALCASTATAADLDKGIAAWNKGDFATALTELQPLADKGDAAAQFYLGTMHEFGSGVPPDTSEAVKWFRLAADQGFADAQNQLGGIYGNADLPINNGVAKDPSEAVK